MPVIVVAVFGMVSGAAAADQACRTDFDSTVAIVTRDYSGYQDRLKDYGARITALTDTIRIAADQAADDSTCTAALGRWMAPFREHDHHIQLWQPRSNPTAGGASPATRAEDRARPTIRFLDDSTAIVTLPNFDRSYKAAIDSLVEAHRARLLAIPYLVVDLRRNPGGADASFRSVMALLYTGPIPRDGFDTWISAGTVARARRMLDDRGVDDATKSEIRAVIQRFEASGQSFWLEGAAGTVRYDSVYALPRAVAVLTGRGCASSCEQFVLDAQHSRKVTVFGTGHTGGFLDYGNLLTTMLPSGVRRLAVPSTRSRRLPERPLDATGITPQVLIPNDEADPIGFAARSLRRPR